VLNTGGFFELASRQVLLHRQLILKRAKALMRVSMLVRWGTALAAALVVSACSDTATAPPAAPAARPHLSDKQFEQWLLDNGGVSRDGRGKKNKVDSVWTQDFVIDPTQSASIKAGDHRVDFPANSICDPATSGYGEDMWDAPCTPLSTPITIHATWNSKYGHAFIDFQPALRFVPTSDPSQYVTITMKDYYDLDPSYHYPIFWNRPSDGMWVDESINDPSLASTEDVNGNRVQRRLKHFSGYLVGAGEVCDAWGGGSCASVMSFAGYLINF
jgi:hypothetical protein